jgi:hypothetical protein
MLLAFCLHGRVDHDLEQLREDLEAFVGNPLQQIGW